jgi:hypothetical protein
MPLRTLLLISLALVVTKITTSTGSSSADGRRTLLFVDDHDVLYSAGLRRQLQSLERHSPGTPVIAADQPYERMLGYTAVHIIEGEYRMWYQAYSAGATYVCYATSRDGLAWTKPRLKQHAWGNIRHGR